MAFDSYRQTTERAIVSLRLPYALLSILSSSFVTFDQSNEHYDEYSIFKLFQWLENVFFMTTRPALYLYTCFEFIYLSSENICVYVLESAALISAPENYYSLPDFSDLWFMAATSLST